MLTLVAALIGTQSPFEYRYTRFAIALHWQRIDWSWFPASGDHIRFDRDFAINIAMLVPLGFGFALWRRATQVRVLGESLVVGSITGVLLELGQLLTRERYTSFADAWRNAVGCVAGALLALVLLRYLRTSAPNDRI